MGRTRLNLKNWRKITQNKSVLDMVKGYKIPFVWKPTQTYHPQTQPTDPIGFTDQLRDLPSVRKGSNRRGGYVSTSLLKQPFPCCQTFREEKASNKSPTFKKIRSESKIQDGEHFTSERHFETKQFSHQNRLKRCFLQHLPIAKTSRKYLQFIYHNKLYQFCVLPFGISTAPRVFSKILKPVIALLRTRGISLIIYLDDLLIAAGTYIDCLNHTKQVISLLESLGFRTNYEKSMIIPTQKLEFLGFIIDSTSMSLALPVGKIQSIKLSA